MSKFYTQDAWVDTFKPIVNPNNNWDECSYSAFETYGEDYEFVKAQEPNKIWTEVDGDEGTYIVAGWHYVNRIQYFITENPWEDEYTEVPSWCYRMCDCQDETEDGEYDPNCTECEEGTIDIPCDTVEDLKQIYGEDNADIVG
jgi:hypothetical protein